MPLFEDVGIIATGSTTERDSKTRWSKLHKDVMDFGATGNGDTDDRTAILAAINAAFNERGAADEGEEGSYDGCEVYLPAGVYFVSDGINNFNQGNASIRLRGAGRYSTFLVGNFPGYVVDKPQNGQQNLAYISDMTVINLRVNADSGAIRFDAAEKGVIFNVKAQGFNAIQASYNTYCTGLYNCELQGPAGIVAGTIGLQLGQGGVYQTRLQGFDVGMRFFNAGIAVSGCAIERSNLAWQAGFTPPKVFLASFSGTTMTITRHLSGGRVQAGSPGDLITGTGIPGGTTVSAILTGDLGDGGILEGTATISADVGTLSERTITVASTISQVSGLSIVGSQTERCNTAADFYSVGSLHFAGNTITGTEGTQDPTNNTSITWSSAGGGTATVTKTAHGYSTGNKVRISGASPAGYNGDYTITVTGDDTFTYAISDPGSTPASPAGTSNRFCIYGLRFRGVTGGLVSGSISVQADTAAVDLEYDGGTSGTGLSFVGVIAGSWIMPTSTNRKACYGFLNCDNPAQVMTVGQLPGNGTSDITTAVEGMEFNVTDGTDGLSWGVTLTDSGTHTTHYKTRYNGTNWTVVGK
jgi:hypothetical protein